MKLKKNTTDIQIIMTNIAIIDKHVEKRILESFRYLKV
jgi:hypothetical protein